ncbi:MAG TPA: amidohydrolase family protein [Planctomycetota bacterium]|nr:amidohydrolase family protein [Planctomycetota bacterium]
MPTTTPTPRLALAALTAAALAVSSVAAGAASSGSGELARPAAAEGKLAIKAGKVIPGPGRAAIDGGVILIEGGRITAVGRDVQIPWDATVIDAPDWTAFPGFVEAHTSRGMDRPNENLEVAPFLSVRDSIDPINFYFEDALRWGLTTINVEQGHETVIAGQGIVVKPWGLTVEEMTVKPVAGIKISATPKRTLSGATQAQVLRRAFGDLRRYLEDLVQQKKEGSDRSRREALFQGRELEGEKAKGRAMEGSAWKVEGLERVPRGEIDEKQEPLLALVEGRIPAFVYCGRPSDVRLALEVARENGFLARTTLVVSPVCWKAADEIAEAGVPIVIEGGLVHTERDPFTGKEIETFVPKVFQERGVRFALSASNSTSESLWYQAALATGLGLTREQALAAVTTVPAEILGLGKRVGSLEPGKDGNVLLFSGDPLSVSSWVERVILEGVEVYDRSKDVRMKHLLEGVTPPSTAAMGEEEEVTHEDEGSPPEAGDEKKDEKEPPPKNGGNGGKGGGR